jgi:hypothetical protein
MTDEPTTPAPSPDPEPVAPEPVAPEPVPPGEVGVGVQDVALGAIVFVAALLLLLGATRIIERGGGGPSPSPSVAVASGSPSEAPSASSNSSPAPSGSVAPSASTGASSSPKAATATPAPSGDPVLVGAGDIGTCGSSGDEATAALLDRVEGTVFTAGDNAYETGSAAEFRDCYDPSWGRHRDRTRPAPGNHDWETARLAGYLGYFGDAAKGPNGSSWYSYDLGTWHVIVLDSTCSKVKGCDPASPQGEWLAADLAASSARCTLAIFHHPRFTSGEHGNTVAMDGFWRPLYAAGVDVVVNGHDHDYERFAPQDPDGHLDGTRGIREFVVGTGGGEFRKFPSIVPNSKLRVAGSHGVIAFTLHDGSFDWLFTAAGNEIRDGGTANCH